MKRLTGISGCLFLITLTHVSFVWAAPDNFGRLFTTPAERSYLQELRNAEPVEDEEPVVVIVPVTDVDVEEKAAPRNQEGITLNGVVVRKDGKSTVWLNGSNSYEGSLASEYFRIEKGDINNKKVLVKIPDVDLEVDLKVGQTYEPMDESLIDIVDSDNEIKASKN